MSSDYRGRGRSSRGRGGPIRGSFRGRGSYMDRDSGGRGGGFRGRGGFSRGRGGPPRSRDDLSPPRMSRSYHESSDRGRGPPPSRRNDRYEDSYDRGPTMRMKDLYSSPPRDSGRSFDRHSPPPRRERDYVPRHHSDHFSSSRGDYLSPRSYSPPRDTGYSSSYKDSYSSGPREERRPMRDYAPRTSDYDRRDFRDTPRDTYGSRDYPPSRNGDFRDSMSSRDFRDAPRSDRYSGGSGGGGSSSRGRSRFDDRGPPREYRGRGRGGSRDDRGRGGFMNGSRGSRGPPRGRGRDFSGGRSDRRSLSREGAGGKRPRLESGDYRR